MRTRSMKVIDMAVHKVATITDEKNITECAAQMRREHVGSLVVVDRNNRPIGSRTVTSPSKWSPAIGIRTK